MKRLIVISAISLSILFGWFVLSAEEDPSTIGLAEFSGKAIAEERAEMVQIAAGRHRIEFRNEGIIMSFDDHAVRIEFIGANPVAPAVVRGSEPLEKVVYKELWEKIDLVYEKTAEGVLKSSYFVSPGGDPSAIRLRYNDKVVINPGGELVLTSSVGRMTESKPVAWQEKGYDREPVTAVYRKLSDHEAGFAVSGWDGRSPLVIDPVLEWNTFFGTNIDDLCDVHSIFLDASGNAYICGYGFATWGSPLHAYAGGGDVFVAKIDSDGNLLWNTFLGGTGGDNDHGITVDSSGNVLVTGSSSATWGSPVRAYTGNDDAFVAKLDNSGNLLWNTFLGESTLDRGSGIITDGTGNAFISGYSQSTWGSPKRAFSGNPDAFAAKLDGNGNLVWNTFLGGLLADFGFGIAIDGSGNLFVTGYSFSSWGSPLQAYNALTDAFVAKLNVGGDLLWSTFVGGSGYDYSYGIVADSPGNAFLSGYSGSAWGSPVRAYSNGDDAFVAKLDTSGGLSWNTFLGGSGNEHSWGGIGLDAVGNVFVSGNSSATWGSPVRAYSGGWEAFAAKLNGSGALSWSAFLGGSQYDNSYGLAVDAAGNSIVSGYSNGTWGSPVGGYSGNNDVFAAKLRLPVISGNTGSGEVTLSYDDGGAKTVTSDSSGNYSFSVSDNWSGAITPVKPGYVFTPANRVYANVTADQTGQDYTAILTTYTISGTILVGGSPLAGVVMSGLTGNPTTDASGVYSGTVTYNWSGTVTPTLAGYTFNPTNRVYSNIAADQTGQDYTATLTTYMISGTILVGGSPLAGVVMSGLTGNPTTNSSGVYTGSEIVNWSGTVTPVLAGYGFTPFSRSYTNLDADQTGQNYTAALLNTSNYWNTFLGSGVWDTCRWNCVFVDSSGNVFVSGYSNATWGSPVSAYRGGTDTFVAKLDSSGNLIWNTFLGGSGNDLGMGIVVDSTGSILLAGNSNAAWGAPVRAYSAGIDAFAAKLDGSGNLIWNTFLGGSGSDSGYGIGFDGTGNIYVSGSTYASTWGIPVRAFSAGNDAFAAKLDGSGSLLWNTFLGGGGFDYCHGIAIDSSGNVLLPGYSAAAWGSPVRAYSNGNDAFAAKLDSSGNLLWNTFLGGSGSDYNYGGIAVDATGNAFISGYSSSNWGSPVRAYSAGNDAFAVKLNDNGTLLWNTFIGGSGSDAGYGIAVNGSENIFITGYSNATWASPVRPYSAGFDAFAGKLDGSGNLLANTFLGGNGGDYGYGIAVDAAGSIVVTGSTNSSWGSPVRAYSGNEDVFAAKFGWIIISGNTGSGGVTLSYNDGGTKTVISDPSGNYTLAVSFNWSGTITPAKAGYIFTPPAREYTNVLADQSAQDYAALFVGIITITSPNGGESWMVGTTHDITWTTEGTVGNVDIHYSTDSGSTWVLIVSGTDNDGLFNWNSIPNTISSTCLVRVQETDGFPTDQSDAVFSIIAYETVSMPTTPSGPSTGMEGGTFTYSTGGSLSSLGHGVQYRFDWGDGTFSIWLPLGTTTASHVWSVSGTYNVRAMARCSIHTDIVSELSTSFTVTLDETPTWAAISRFQASEAESRPTVEWHTASEIGTIGFNLWRQDRKSGEYELVNPSLLPALPGSPQGGVYRFVDPGAFPGEPVVYRMEEVDALGRTRSYGPFTVTFGASRDGSISTEVQAGLEEPSDVYGYQRFPRELSRYEKERLQELRLERQQGMALAAGQSKERARITVKGQGLFYVAAAQVARSLGMSQTGATALIGGYNLRLTGLGKEIAWLADANGAGLFFYNEGVETVYCDRNVYFLDKGRGRAMETLGGGNSGTADPDQSYSETLHFEGNRYALLLPSMDPAKDLWFWDYIVAGSAAKPFPIAVPGVASGKATLKASLQGATATVAESDHHAIISLNGRQVGEAVWAGTRAHEFEVEFDASLLQDGANTIEVSGTLDSGAPYSTFYVESFDLSYPRYYKAVENRLICRRDGNSAITVSGIMEQQAVVLDVSNPIRPKQLTGVSPDVSGRVSFVPSSAGNAYLVSGLNAALRPLAVAGARPAELKGPAHSAEYIVIAPEEFTETARQLAKYRQGRKLKSLVVTLEEIYDTFNHGVPSPYAIRDFLAHAYAKWGGKRVQYAVLAGKGTYDYHDCKGYGDNLVPAILGRTPEGLCAADRIFGDVKGRDGLPEIAIGRLPALSSGELQAMINKIKAYESGQGEWTDQALFIADNADSGGDFAASCNELAGLATGLRTEKIYLAGPAAETRSRIISSWNAGAALVSYCGHGGINQLATENIFAVADARALDNGGRLPLATMFTCVAGRFELPGFTSLGEALLLNDKGGMAGGLLPSGAAMNFDSLRLGAEFYKAMYRGRAGSAGKALLAALKNYLFQGGPGYLLNVYNWLGDPALEFK